MRKWTGKSRKCKRRQSIGSFLKILSKNQKLSKIIGSDVRHGTRNGKKTKNSKIIGCQIELSLSGNFFELIFE